MELQNKGLWEVFGNQDHCLSLTWGELSIGRIYFNIKCVSSEEENDGLYLSQHFFIKLCPILQSTFYKFIPFYICKNSLLFYQRREGRQRKPIISQLAQLESRLGFQVTTSVNLHGPLSHYCDLLLSLPDSHVFTSESATFNTLPKLLRSERNLEHMFLKDTPRV